MGLGKVLTMTKVNAGNAVKLGNSNVYAILGSTKKGPQEFAKLGVAKDAGNVSSNIPMKKVVSMPSDNYFESYMTYEQVGKNFANMFEDFSYERFNEIMEFLKFDKAQTVGEYSAVSVQKLKIATTLSRNARVYMLDNPFQGMNSTAREEMLRVIFSWAIAAETIAVLCHNTDEVSTMVDYSIEHENDLPVIATTMRARQESFA
ncbi:MAG: hypothetical protein K6C69_04565 [Lachnospiraceae bacterium]|nr:hypothetical protein [Lachnospiraceae bacterium]